MDQYDPFCMKENTNKTIFYDTKHFMVLYDIKPVVPGHSLFVPKRHVVDLLELSLDELRDFYSILHYVIPRMLRLYESTENSYDLSSQIGPYSGRTVPHLHVHLLPRRSGDKYQMPDENIFNDIKTNKTSATYEDVKVQIDRLRKEFRYKEQTK